MLRTGKSSSTIRKGKKGIPFEFRTSEFEMYKELSNFKKQFKRAYHIIKAV